MPEDRIPAVFQFGRNFETRMPSRADWEEISPLIETDIIIYTDGSKTDDGTRAGAYSQ